MVSRPIGRDVRGIALASSVAALTAACSQSGNPPARSVASDTSRGSINRPLFTEEAYGVSTSARVATGGRVPKGGGNFKLGSPYKVAGRWYVPREEPNYDRQGIGSWYGDDFHGRKTANGEVFDKNALSAAHPTLPLPSYAYVTNIATGRTILVRVNDRGPYVADRLIDLSHASARALGYENQGHARVRVRYAGRAPLNGDDRRERQFLAEQRWNTGRDASQVAAYRPPQAPVTGPQPFPEGTPGRWSPTGYRAALAGKPIPDDVRPRQQQPWGGGTLQPTASITQPPLRPMASRSAQPDAYRPAALGGDPARLSGAERGTGRAFVHVGVFRERSNAERLRRELGNLGPIEVAPLGGGQGAEMYRVRLGPMTANEALAAADQVTARGVNGSSVVFE